MNRIITLLALALVVSFSTAALALDGAALTGKWKLVENAKDGDGNPCPFVGQQIEFTAGGKMISANMPAPFNYKINPTPAEADAAIARKPDLKGMDIMLAMMGSAQGDWTKAPIVYGVQIKDRQLFMKVAGYTPARYKKLK